MGDALDAFEVEGIGHNLPFLSAVMDHPRFREGALTTAFIAEEYPDGFVGVPVSEDDARVLAAVAAQINLAIEQRNMQITGRISSEKQSVATDWVATLGGFTLPVRIVEGEGGTTINFVDGGSLPVASDWHPGSHLGSFTVGGKPIAIKVSRVGTGWRLRWRGMDMVAHVRKPRVAELAKLMPVKLPPDTSKMLLCPMPGVITSILVKDGETVEAGQPLATVEAMKMENVLRAERRATVKRITAEAGSSLAVDELIMEFE